MKMHELHSYEKPWIEDDATLKVAKIDLDRVDAIELGPLRPKPEWAEITWRQVRVFLRSGLVLDLNSFEGDIDEMIWSWENR